MTSLLWIAIAFCAFVLVLPVWLAPVLGSESAAYSIHVENALQPPSLAAWFGTDNLGRSQWDRFLFGAGNSFYNAAGSLGIALPLCLVMGGIAGHKAGHWPDKAISWAIAMVHATPFFLVVVAFTAVFSPGLESLPWLIAAVIWAPPARLVRGEVIRLNESRFVLSERAGGLSRWTILLASILPLTLAPTAVSLLYLFPEIVGIDVALSFFGLGAHPPTPTLGRLIYDGLRRWDPAWWLATFPSLGLFAYCLLLHAMADMIGRITGAAGK